MKIVLGNVEVGTIISMENYTFMICERGCLEPYQPRGDNYTSFRLITPTSGIVVGEKAMIIFDCDQSVHRRDIIEIEEAEGDW